jgi:hypothetical protein
MLRVYAEVFCAVIAANAVGIGVAIAVTIRGLIPQDWHPRAKASPEGEAKEHPDPYPTALPLA